ncbi:mitogen-activated protein kinase kinase kinase 1-like isoform X2 [Wolffia australiana]
MNLLGVLQQSRQKETGESDGGASPDRKQRRKWLSRSKICRNRADKDSDFYSDGNSARKFCYEGLEGSSTRSDSHLSGSNEACFCIRGEADGQFAALCESFGVADPEDFAITPRDWMAAETPLAGDCSKSPLIEGCSPPQKLDELDVYGCDAIPSTFTYSQGGGIKGPRPSVLAPPPKMSLPAVDKFFTTWDLVSSLAPDEASQVSTFDFFADVSSLESEKEKEMKERRVGVSGFDPMSSGSLWTSQGEDSSSTTPDLVSPNFKQKLHISPGSWTKGKLLGQGSFGAVYQAFSEDGSFFAIKEVSLVNEGPNVLECIQQLEKEVELLSQLEHENIVKYLGTEKEESTLYIFLEYVPLGSLASLYQNFKLQDSHVSAYTRQILNGLKYLHDRNIVHRDIKCANILLAVDGSIKLADFGLAKQVANPVASYGTPADIWSLGCTVLEMLTQKHPFPDLDWVQAVYHIGSGRAPAIPKSLSKKARDFIGQCTQVNPRDRPSAACLLEHPFIKRTPQTLLRSSYSTGGGR